MSFDARTAFEILRAVWPWLAGGAAFLVTLVAAAHVILNKRDGRAAIGWVGLILLSPFLGALTYYIFGINRIKRKASRLVGKTSGREERRRGLSDELEHGPMSRLPPQLRVIERTVEAATGARLTFGNAVEPLVNGDAGYPVMLESIEQARCSVALATYIFDNDNAGALFVDALAAAAGRGVEVRVLIDGVGARYSRPRMTRVLRDRGVRVAEFLPSRLPWRNPYMNLRNHRKLLIVDRRIGYTGGFNIREGNLLGQGPRSPIQDLHFRLDGPVVNQLFAAFHEDWLFTTGENLAGAAWRSRVEREGTVMARGIADGPDEDFETIRWTIQAALCKARESVRIATPYFLPDLPLITSLQLAAMRGIRVEIVLPEKNNLRFVQWASTAQLWQVLQRGCRIWLSPPPFDHSKVMVVDGAWSMVGSANWDPRSLRLNFELNVECYDGKLAAFLLDYTGDKMTRGRELTLAEVDGRSLPARLRDGVTRLFAPYL